ncbi:MAG: hypothetical protein J7L61_03605 [Thermoplasmata archaeon]|nr:hypothetical protein [Thermoplasmata archaeon]
MASLHPFKMEDGGWLSYGGVWVRPLLVEKTHTGTEEEIEGVAGGGDRAGVKHSGGKKGREMVDVILDAAGRMGVECAVVDAERVGSRALLLHGVLRAVRRRNQGKMRSRTLPMETLLCLAGTRQTGRAVETMSPREVSSRMWLVLFFSPTSETPSPPSERKIEEMLSALGLRVVNPPDEPPKEVLMAMMEESLRKEMG